MKLIIAAAALDAAAAALEKAGEAMVFEDGRKSAGPQLSRDGYKAWVVTIMEQLTGSTVLERLPPPVDPKDTWP